MFRTLPFHSHHRVVLNLSCIFTERGIKNKARSWLEVLTQEKNLTGIKKGDEKHKNIIWVCCCQSERADIFTDDIRVFYPLHCLTGSLGEGSHLVIHHTKKIAVIIVWHHYASSANISLRYYLLGTHFNRTSSLESEKLTLILCPEIEIASSRLEAQYSMVPSFFSYSAANYVYLWSYGSHVYDLIYLTT